MKLTDAPTEDPTSSPTRKVTDSPTSSPTSPPTKSLTSSPTEQPTISPTKSPTTSPTLPPTNTPTIPQSPKPTNQCNLTPTQRTDQIYQTLSSISPTSSLLNPNTPQGRASTWLIADDTYYICPDDDNVIQRYIMALFYYSTNGFEWVECSANILNSECDEFRYLSALDECVWFGNRCAGNDMYSIIFDNNGLSG